MTEAYPGIAGIEASITDVLKGMEQAYLDAQAALEDAQLRANNMGAALVVLSGVAYKELLGPYDDNKSAEPTLPPTAQDLYNTIAGIHQRHPDLFPQDK